MKKTITKILNIIVDVIVVAILIVSVLVLTLTLTSKGDRGVPSIFGKAPISVLTPSMEGDKEDSFNKGDLIICDIYDLDAENNDLKVGDIITFNPNVTLDDNEYNVDYVTHRIIEINKDGSFKTKGDANETYDQDPKNNTVFPSITEYDVLAVYHGTKLSGVGGLLTYLQTPTGFLWILIPMIIFFLYQAVRVVINIVVYNKEKAIAKARETIANSDLTEEQKQKAIEEYLAAQAAKEAEADKQKTAETEESDSGDSDEDDSAGEGNA